MSVNKVVNGQLVRADASAASQLIAVDTDNILGGGAGAQTNSQAMFDELSDRAIALNSSLTDQQGEIEAILDVYSAKNIFDNKLYTRAYDGVTWTVATDKKFTTSGTTSADNRIPLNESFYLSPGTYILSGCPKASVQNAFRFRLANANDSIVIWQDGWGDNGEKTFTVTTGEYYNLYVRYGNNVNMNGLTFSPMIRDARIKDSTYVTYAPTNRDCVSYAANTFLGAHNLISYPFVHTTKTVNKMTYTDLGNGKVNATSDGATNGTSSFYLVDYTVSTLPKGQYILSDGGASNGDIYLCANRHNGDTFISVLASCNASTHEIIMDVDYNGYNTVRVVIFSKSGITASNKIFEPMIRLASDTDATFATFAMTNRQLTPRYKSMQITPNGYGLASISENPKNTKVLSIWSDSYYALLLASNSDNTDYYVKVLIGTTNTVSVVTDGRSINIYMILIDV